IMRLPRKHRILTALVALFSMLFMQLALASYACPGVQSQNDAGTMGMEQTPVQAMPGCDQPDPASPALCHAHCLDGKSSLDKPQTPFASPAAVIVSSILTPIEPLLPAQSSSNQLDSFLNRITSPPIAIRHCCLRI